MRGNTFPLPLAEIRIGCSVGSHDERLDRPHSSVKIDAQPSGGGNGIGNNRWNHRRSLEIVALKRTLDRKDAMINKFAASLAVCAIVLNWGGNAEAKAGTPASASAGQNKVVTMTDVSAQRHHARRHNVRRHHARRYAPRYYRQSYIYRPYYYSTPYYSPYYGPYYGASYGFGLGGGLHHGLHHGGGHHGGLHHGW